MKEGKAKAEAAHEAALITDGKCVAGMSGMTCVIPSAFIADLVMNDPNLQRMRATNEMEIAPQNRPASPGPVAEASS